MKREYHNKDVEALINDLVHKERDRALVKRRLCDGIAFEPLAEEFDLSVRQCKRIVYKASEKIFR